MNFIQKISFFNNEVAIVASDFFILEVRLSRLDDQECPNAITNKVAVWLKEYEKGNFIDFDFSLIESIANPKTKRDFVLAELTKVRVGEITTYKDLSAKVGLKKAYRFVGTCMAQNNIPIIIPCHRVLKSDLSLGKYSFGDPEFKNILLEHEKLMLKK